MILEKNEYIEKIGKQLAFIFPSDIVGGHELMAIEIVKDFLSLNIDIIVYVEPTNIRLLNVLNDVIKTEKIKKLPIKKRRLESISAFFDPMYMDKIGKFIKQDFLNKDYNSIILVQGDIEIGSPYVVAFKREKVEITSYIPFTHTKLKMKKKFAFLRDYLDSILYTYVKKFITIYSLAAFDLRSFNPHCEISIIPNKVRDMSEFKKLRNNIPISEKILVFIIGRVEYMQKGHDRFINVLRDLDDRLLKKMELHIIGDGPDFIKLRNDLSGIKNLSSFFHGWMGEPWLKAYSADLLVIPSRFEGVPLIMLEAQEVGVPILAAKVDGMIDYLKPENLFEDDIEFEKMIIDFLEKHKR